MKKTVIDPQIVTSAMSKFEINDLNKASIRQIVGIVGSIEKESGEKFIHLEIGAPGFSPSQIGIEAEHKALDMGVPSKYPAMEGIPELKVEASRFIKSFVDTDIPARCCVPTVGSMQGAYAAFVMAAQINPQKDTILFIDPGFSVQKAQTKMIGVRSESFDVFHYRADKLEGKLESYLSTGRIAAIIYSNPNNPTWMCLCDSELKTIGELATKYDVIVIEDLAYMAMDFRKELGTPSVPPYQLSVSKYTDNYIILMSASKIFSYAGQRIAIIAVSEKIFDREYLPLTEIYGIYRFGQVLTQRVLYCLSAGATHTAQYALTAMLKAASDGELDFVEEMKEYGRRAKRLKEIFLRSGFHIVYDRDLDEPLSDGFFFTVGYRDRAGNEIEGGKLQYLLLHYGVSGIVLSTTGSVQQGLRICPSTIESHHYEILDQRLAMFNKTQGEQANGTF